MRTVRISHNALRVYVISCYEGDNLISQHVIADDYQNRDLFFKTITEWLEKE